MADDVPRQAAIHSLHAVYGDDPDFSPGRIASFALTPATAERRAAEYKARLTLWRSWAADAPGKGRAAIPDSFLREHAARGDVESLAEIRTAHLLKSITSRVKARDGRRQAQGESIGGLQPWMLNRIAALYPYEEIDDVAESLYGLRQLGILTYTVRELHQLQRHGEHHATLEHACDPATKRHITFAGALRTASAAERVALLHDHNLTRLVYGIEFDPEVLGTFFNIDDTNGYGIEVIQPVFESLVAAEANAASVVFSFVELDNDISNVMPRAHAQSPRAYNPTAVQIVVAGEKISLADAGLGDAAANLRPAQAAWLIQQVNNLYPPPEQDEAFRKLAKATAAGHLQISGTKGTFSIDLSPALLSVATTDVNRSLVTHLLGADYLFYGRDLENILQQRLGTKDLARFARSRGIIPRLTEREDFDIMALLLSCTPEALELLLRQHNVTAQERVRGDDGSISIPGEKADKILKHQFAAPPHGWQSRTTICSQPNGEQALAAAIEKGWLGAADVRLCRASPTEPADIFYRPDFVRRLGGQFASW